MKIEKKITERFLDSLGKSVSSGNILLYRQKDSVDRIGRFGGIENGLLLMNSITCEHVYSVRPSSIVYCKIASPEKCENLIPCEQK